MAEIRDGELRSPRPVTLKRLGCRVTCRHSNVRCDDDAATCIREAAIKFADQNEDGPLDLILLTGRTALARSSNTLLGVMSLNKPSDVKDACHRDPYL